MGAITAEIAKEHLEIWLEAEKMVSTGQSYTIGDRSLTRANLNEIRNSIEYWEGKVNAAERVKRHGGRNRLIRAVPRDL